MPGARGVALHALVSLQEGRADRLRSALSGRVVEGLPGRDLAFAFELCHGVIRRERLLDFVLEGFAHRGLPKDVTLRSVLRLGVYQLLFVAGMPAHAAVHETVGLLRNNRGFANAMLRHVAAGIEARVADPAAPTMELPLGPTRSFVLPRPLPSDEVRRLARVHSLPDWLVQRVAAQHGLEAARAVASAASATPGTFLRASHDVERASLWAGLADAGVHVEPCPHRRLLRWIGGESPFGTASFAAGQFVVQDPTALAAAEAVPCSPGDIVIDLCAAPGTKTTWLAEQVQPGGRVLAFDPSEERRRRIVENVERLRLGAVVQVVDSTAALPPADCVLADVPCSNSGVLGRRVEVRLRLRSDTFRSLAVQQHALLQQAISAARPGGTIVYSTCSIDREENDDVVAAVLADPGTTPAELVRSHLTLPLAGEHDGGFFAVLRRCPS